MLASPDYTPAFPTNLLALHTCLPRTGGSPCTRLHSLSPVRLRIEVGIILRKNKNVGTTRGHFPYSAIKANIHVTILTY